MSASADKVPVLCPSCNKRLLVPAGTLGKQGRCPACQTVFTLEQLWEAEPVSAPPPPASPFAPPAGAAAGFAAAGNPWGNAAPGQPAKSPYSDDDFAGDYNLQAAPPLPQSNYAPPQFSPVQGGFSGSYSRPKKERGFWDSSVLGGIAMMVIAVVWFFAGLAAGFIFFYPPIMFIIGLFVFFKGLFAGSIAGD